MMAAWDADGAPDLYCYGLTVTEHQQYARARTRHPAPGG